MAKNKSVNKNKKTRRNNKHRRSKNGRKVRGGCGCTGKIFKGGNINPASFQTLPLRNFYELNNYSHDPTMPNNVINSRNLSDIQSGGRKKPRHQTKKMKGGDFLGTGIMNNAVTSFGTTPGAYSGSNIFSGVSSLNSSVIDQPAYQTYSALNPPLA